MKPTTNRMWKRGVLGLALTGIGYIGYALAEEQQEQYQHQNPETYQMELQGYDFLQPYQGTINRMHVSNLEFDKAHLTGSFNVYSQDGKTEYILRTAAPCRVRSPLERLANVKLNAIQCTFLPPQQVPFRAP